jgi:hypothetical protein
MASMGRYAEPARWVLVVLDDGPRPVIGLLDDVRRLDGRVGHATLLGTLARLEQRAWIACAPAVDGRLWCQVSGRSMGSLS